MNYEHGKLLHLVREHETNYLCNYHSLRVVIVVVVVSLSLVSLGDETVVQGTK